MSAKKSFKGNNPALSFISSASGNDAHSAQEAYNAHNAHSAQEAQEVKPTTSDPVSKRTQGKKGEKLPRMNTAYSPENYEHIQFMARLVGCSATEYVNRLIAADREARGDMVRQAMNIFKEVKK